MACAPCISYAVRLDPGSGLTQPARAGLMREQLGKPLFHGREVISQRRVEVEGCGAPTRFQT